MWACDGESIVLLSLQHCAHLVRKVFCFIRRISFRERVIELVQQCAQSGDVFRLLQFEHQTVAAHAAQLVEDDVVHELLALQELVDFGFAVDYWRLSGYAQSS